MTVSSHIFIAACVCIYTIYLCYIYGGNRYKNIYLMGSVFLLLEKIHYKNWFANADVSEHVCPIYPPRISIWAYQCPCLNIRLSFLCPLQKQREFSVTWGKFRIIKNIINLKYYFGVRILGWIHSISCLRCKTRWSKFFPLRVEQRHIQRKDSNCKQFTSGKRNSILGNLQLLLWVVEFLC